MTRPAPPPEQDAAWDRPDTSSSDDELYEFLVRDLLRQGPVTVIRPGVLRVEIPTDDASPPSRRPIEVRMTPAQVRERVTALSAGGQEALGIADPVGAGIALFTIHVEEHLATLRPDESYLLWHRGELHPSVTLEWPPQRGTTRS